jgi:TatD DNase family protein
MRLIDTHAHLHAAGFDADREAVLARATAANVVRIIDVGYDLPSSRASITLARSHPQVYATAGIQPHDAAAIGSAELEELQSLLAGPKVVALGEIGLDYYHDRAPRAAQRALFEAQLGLAVEHKLPVVIHSREAHADTVEVLAAAAHPYPVVMHSFSGDRRYAEACLDLGAYLSFSGPLTFPRASELREVATHAPLDRLLVETDCPYLSPHPFRGKRNEPERVRLIAERLAALRGMTLAELADSVWHNACAAFGLRGDTGVGGKGA